MQQPEPGIGHNSEAPAHNLTVAAREKLKQVVAQIERLEEEKRDLARSITEVYAGAKSMGYDTKALRRMVRERRMDRQEREEQEMIDECYRIALEMKD